MRAFIKKEKTVVFHEKVKNDRFFVTQSRKTAGKYAIIITENGRRAKKT